ncbi:hypothetical protein HDU97_000576 [Phlyctochytrium planicorne]|nr:hypothetical protein HDU97_000576 [Phlyctochytrium planicorne]
MYTFFAVTFATMASILVKAYAPYAAGEGVPEIKTILGGFVIRKFLGGWTLLIKIVGLVLAVGSGLSLGKEGPLVHISCCLGNILPRMFKKYANNEAKKREILSASSAAGVSVAFGAPVGGVLFSLEEVSYYFPYKTMWRSFFCAMVGAIALRLLDPFRTGKLVWFQVKYSRDWHAFELPMFVLLGVLGGLSGTLFIRMNLFIGSLRKSTWLKDRPILEVAAIALLTGLVGYSHVYLRVNTVDLVANLFRECEEVDGDFYGLCKKEDAKIVIFLLLVAAVIKFFLTVVTFGTMVPAGVFLPTIAIGACVGRAIGILMQMFQDVDPNHPVFSTCNPKYPQCITPGTYAMVGAAAFLSGTTRMTVSLTVIMFELTGAVSYVLPIIITILTAKWVGDAGGKGIYYLLIRLEGYPFLDGSEEYRGEAVVEEIMTKSSSLEMIPEIGLTVSGLEDILHNTKYKGFPIVSGQMKLVGYAGRAELRFAISSFKKLLTTTGSTPIYFTDPPDGMDPTSYLDMRPWIEVTPSTLPPHFPVGTCVELFKKMGSRYVLITAKGRLLGVITKKDLLRHVMLVKSNGPVDELFSPELSLKITLNSGQSFRWRETGDNQYSSVVGGHVISLRQTNTDVLFTSHTSDNDTAFELLNDYFRLDIKLEDLYKQWSMDMNFEKRAKHFQGIRLLRQDPIENLVTFICTSNNNISRITQMIEKLCAHYGEEVNYRNTDLDGLPFFHFPTLSTLNGADVEKTLRELGFGYRARYIKETASKILEENGGEPWLYELRKKSYDEAKDALLSLSGVGPKVADCILLMSLDKMDAVPVDTHVWQIAKRDYGFAQKSTKTLTPKVYKEIGDIFRSRFGIHAGWAQAVLFKAKLEKDAGEDSSLDDTVTVKILTEKGVIKRPFPPSLKDLPRFKKRKPVSGQ